MKIGYIVEHNLELNPHLTEKFTFREATFTRRISSRGDRVYSKMLQSPVDYEEIVDNANMMKNNSDIILVREPFLLDDELKEYAPDDKELIKLVKKTYGKKNANADFIIMKGDEIINFIKAYGADEKSDGMFYFKSDTLKKYKSDGVEHKYTVNGGVKELTKPYYSYQHRALKVNEVIAELQALSEIEGVKVYALEITDDMIKQYQELANDRKKPQ